MAAFETIEAQLSLDSGGFSSGIGEAVGELGSLGSAAEEVNMRTAALGTALAGLAAGGLAASVKAASSFQDEMIELEKVTNPETAAAMSDEIKNMAETIPLAQEELAQIASDAGRFGVRGEENIQSFTTAVSKMATATDLSATDAGESLAKLAELTGTPIGEVENLGSSINELSNNMATSSSEIVDSMLRSSSAMSQFGLTQTEIAGFSGALNAVSESSERAGSRLRRLMQEMQNPKKISNIAQALGMTVEEFRAMQENDPAGLVRSMAAAMAEGGTTAENLNRTLSTTSRQAISGLGQNLDGLDQALKMSASSFEENTSLQKEFDAASRTLSNQVQLLRNRLTNVGISIGNVLLPPLTTLVQFVAEGVSVFSSFNSALGGLPGALTLIGTLLTGLAMTIGSFAAVLSTSSLAAAGLSGALAGLGAAFSVLTGPIGLAAAAIAGLAYAFQTDFAGIRTQTMRVVQALRDVFGPVIQRVFGLARTVLADLSQAFAGFGGGAESSIARVVTAVGNWLVGAITRAGTIVSNWLTRLEQWWRVHGDTVVAVVNTLATGVRMAFQIMANGIRVTVAAIRAILGPFIDWIGAMWAQHGERITTEARRTWAVVRDVISRFVAWARPYLNGFVEFMSMLFGGVLDRIQRFWRVWGEDIMAHMRMVVDTIRVMTESLIDFLATTISVGLALIRGDWSGAWDLIEGYLRRTVGRIQEVVRGWVNVITGYIQTFVEDGIAWFQELYRRLVGGSIVPDMLDDILSVFDNILGRVLGVIGDFAGDTIGRFGRLASDSVGALRDKISDFRAAGKAMVLAVGEGIRRNVSRVKGTVSGAAQTIRDYWPSSPAKEGPLSDIDDIGPELMQEIANGIASNGGLVIQASEQAAEGAQQTLSSAVEGMGSGQDSGLTLHEIQMKHGEFDSAAAFEALGTLGSGQRLDLANALEDTKWFDESHEASRQIRDAVENENLSQQLYDGLIRQSGAFDELEALVNEGTRQERLVQAEDGSYVDPGFYGDESNQSTQEVDNSITIDFGGLPDDAMISIGALKEEFKRFMDTQEERESTRSVYFK